MSQLNDPHRTAESREHVAMYNAALELVQRADFNKMEKGMAK